MLCGQCLPHCPSYRLWRSEPDSPRGRIAMIQALARGQLEPGPGLIRHLDRCLGCRACERMCPSLVEYGKILDQGRALLKQPHPPALQQLLNQLADSRGLQRKAGALRWYQRSGMQDMVRRSGILKPLGLAEQEAALPQLPARTKLESDYPARRMDGQAAYGTVALFTGCLGNVLEATVQQAAIHILTRIGFNVLLPPGLGCCGALHQHNGELDEARAMAQHNLKALGALDQPLCAILSTASGCAAQLYEYESLYGEALPAPLYEISDFLASHWLPGLAVRPMPIKACYQLACSQRNVLRKPDAAVQLLQHIPQLELSPLPGNDQCCGGAGSFMITQKEQAAALRQPKLDALLNSGASVLLSTNIGCAMHLRSGLQGQQSTVRVCHPVELLAECLD